jgi:protein required for attachment to host cells
MRTRIVLADESEARFYDVDRFDEPLHLIGKLTDANARLHDRDLKSDRPGRVFDHAAASNQRRGAVGHHSTGGERTPRKHEAEVFAREIARDLQTAHEQHRFERIVIMAGPPFLGVLRNALPKAVSALIVREIPKDLIHEPDSAIREHLAKVS